MMTLRRSKLYETDASCLYVWRWIFLFKQRNVQRTSEEIRYGRQSLPLLR